MATTNETTINATSAINAFENVDTATGLVGLTSDVTRNVTQDVEYTKFTDSSLLISDNAAIVETQIDDVEDTASVVSFLKRPCQLYYATLDATSIQPISSFASDLGPADQPIVTSFAVPNATLNFGNRIQKITNFEWFKADTVFRIMSNVNPYVAGKLWACFAPYDDLLLPEVQIRKKGRAAITSYPGVEIDLQSTNAATLRVPWSGAGDAFSLTSNDNPIGRFYLFALTPIMAVGNPKIPIQIFSHFENISITGPTPIPVSLQGAAREGKGPIQEVSGQIRNISNSIKDVLAPIPVVGTIASAVPWVAGAVEGVASIFGWTRPVVGSGVEPMASIPGRGYAQNKVEDSSTMLAFNNDNKIAETGYNFLETIDEMSTEHICGRPGLISSTKWLVDSVPLAKIASHAVGPYPNQTRQAIWPVGTTTYTVYDLNLFENLSTLFGQWKADLHYRINVVRTPFHVGRFEVFFVPRVTSADLDVSNIDTTNLYRHIVDITETNDLEFVIPYMQNFTMCSRGTDIMEGANNQSVGVVVIRALSPLNCPDTVSQYVTVNVWSWATNVAFACPIGNGLKVPPAAQPARLQGVLKNEETNASTIVFGKVNTPERLLDTTTTVGGEMAINMRQMTRTHRQFDNAVGNEHLINTNLIGGFGGYVGKMANIFAFYRGGISFKLIPTETAIMDWSKYIKTILVRTVDNKPIFGDNVEHTTYPLINPFHEIQAPFYSNTRRGICNFQPANTTADNSTRIQPGVYIQTNITPSLNLLIGGKDDLTFGYLIGPPLYSTVETLSRKLNEIEKVDAELQGAIEQEEPRLELQRQADFLRDTLSPIEGGAIYYYGTNTKHRRAIMKRGFYVNKRLVVFKDKNSISPKKTVIYSLRLLPCQVVRDLGDRIVVNDITELHEVSIHGHVFEFWKHVSRQSYNPLNLISNANEAMSGITSVTAALSSTLESVNETLQNWKITLMGNEVQGIVVKASKIIANAFMAQRELLLYNLLMNVLLEFGSTIYNKVVEAFGVTHQLQGITDMLDMNILKKYLNDKGQVSALVVTSVLSLIFLCSFGIPFSGGIDGIIKTTGNRARSLKNVFDFTSAANAMFSEVGNNLMYYAFGTIQTPELDQYVSGYKDWTVAVLELGDVTDSLAQRIEKDEKLVLKIDNLYKQGIRFAPLVGNIKTKENIQLHYNKIFKIIEEARKLCDYTGVFGNKPRVKPVVIQLFGESGVGKSGMTWPLASDLNILFCDNVEQAQDYSQEIYARNTEQEFWDGYGGQNIVIYDDFGQRVDTQNSPNEEFMELIRAANIAPYPLHMAELSEKKRTKFISKVIMLTSNILHHNVSSLTFPDAFRRRIDICGRVYNKSEYTMVGNSATTGEKVERLDVSKCASAVDTKPYLIELYDPETMKPIYENGRSKIVDYEEFVTMSCKLIKYNISKSVDFNDNISKRINSERFEKIKASLQGMPNMKKIPECFRAIKDELFDRVRGAYKEFTAFRGALVLLGVLLTGLGIFIYGKYTSKSRRRDTGTQFAKKEATSGDSVTSYSRLMTRENTSGDSITKRGITLVKEAVSGDSITRRVPNIYREATSGDNITKKNVIIKREATSGDNLTKKSNNILRESVYDEAELQMWRDVGAQELITNRLINNQYMISKKNGGEYTKVLQCLFIRDTVALCPRHLLLTVKDNDIIQLTNINGVSFELPFNKVKRVLINSQSGFEKDAMLLQFPRNYINSHGDIVKHFQIMPEISARRAQVCIPTIRKYSDHLTLTVLGNSDCRITNSNLGLGDGEDVLIRDSLEYDLNTTFGDCGSPVVCQETTFIRKIMGIHIAGRNDGTGAFGQSVTRMDLEIALEKLKDVIINDVDQLPNIAINNVDLQCNVEYRDNDIQRMCGIEVPAVGVLGSCAKNVFVPNKSDIKRSILYGKLLPPRTAPSVLYSPEENVMVKNFKKNAINTPYISEAEVDRAVSEVRPLLLNNRSPRLARILTYEEAIRGSDDSEYLSSITRSSSPGYPWVLDKKAGFKGKTQWFGKDETFLYDEEVRAAVDLRLENARRGKRTPTVWCATLKDERRELEKVRLKKTRVFANGPQDFTIAYRMYFLGFQAHVMENRITNEQSLGTNPFGFDWTRTAKHLQTRGAKVFAGDFSSFDGTLNANIMVKFVDIVNEFYNDGPENALIRQVLFMEVYNSIQLCEGKFISLTHSQPSGNPGTTVLNSFYNSVSMRIAFYRCVKDKKFKDHVSMVSYGDDNVINISDAIAKDFNQLKATEAYASFGMIYTDETKSGTAVEYRDLSEVAYLKRKFRKVGPIYRAPSPLEVIMETPNWHRSATDPIEQTKDNVSGSIEELAQHPESVYNEYTKILVETFYDTTGEYPEYYDYQTYNDEWNREMGFTE